MHVEIVSPERLILSEEAGAVSVPGSEGYFTVMGDHAALLTTLKPGFVTVGEGGDAHRYYVEGGFADVSPSGVTILADSARSAGDFSPAEIEAALRRAEETLAAAEGIEAKDAAQYILDGWKNLMLEAAQTGGVTPH
ncbi:MAG TPA: ATP synthase F1 subunit epsilon [Methylocystis sp.]